MKNMHFFAQGSCHNHQKRHGDHGQDCQFGMGDKHDGKGGTAKKDGVHKHDQSKTESHPDMIDITCGMGHDIPCFDFVIIGHVQIQDMPEKRIPDVFFKMSGTSHEKISPHIS